MLRTFPAKCLLVLGTLLFLSTVFPASADDVSTATASPPAIYKEKLAKLLTPLDEVLQKKADYEHYGEGEDGVALLDETITYANPDGTRFSVYHTVYRGLNKAGVKFLSQSTFSYKRKAQKAFLVLAQTIQEDGTKSPVQHDAIFLKTPQGDSDDSIYDDQVDLVAIYPNVKEGSLTENITVLEDVDPKIPNEFSEVYTWMSGWPEYQQRFVLDLPDTLGSRLKITNLGQSIPSYTKLELPDHRQQLNWELAKSPADREDSTEAPAYQIGPVVWVSTLKDWDAFAKWYNALTLGTDHLSSELKSKVDEWTKGVTSPEKILSILYSHVAEDVRYTGIELGKSDMQPHDCSSVWQQQYGDCKDKANLLRAMLAYKGIPAWLTLLDTEYAGLVNRANPDHRQFDHCITCVQLGERTIFCDPTITFGVPGVLNGSSTDRDVLVIKGDHASWQRTPPFKDASISYSFDLELHASGELSGWVTLTACGYYGASFKKRYQDYSKEDAISHLQGDVQGFFPNSTIVDLKAGDPVALDTSSPLPPPYVVKAFMTLPGILNPSDTTAQIKFPSPDPLLPSFENYKLRSHTTFMWPDLGQVSVKIKLPKRWSTDGLPSPFSQDSAFASMNAGWTSDPTGILAADFSVTLKKNLYPSDDWKTLGDNVTDLESWASKALTLTRQQISSGTIPPLPKAKTDDDLAAEMPVMPTGEGQLTLIDNNYPEDGNAGVRRAVLRRVATLFPTDKKARFEADIRVATMDLDDKKYVDVIDRLSPLEEAYRATMDETTLAWGNYIMGLALKDGGKPDEAESLFKQIAENENVDAYRRGWSVYQASQLMAPGSPKAALDYADTGLKIDSDSVGQIYAFYADTALSSNFQDRLKDRLSSLIASKPQGLNDILQALLDKAKDLLDNGNRDHGKQLVKLLQSLQDPVTTGESFAKSLKDLADSFQASDEYSKIQKDLEEALKDFPEIAALEKRQPAFSSQDDAAKSASQHEDAAEPDDALGCALRVAIGYPADKDMPDHIWSCVRFAEWGLRCDGSIIKEPFFNKLAALSDELPHGSDGFTDSKLMAASVCERDNRRADAAKIYDYLAHQNDLADGFAGAIFLRQGKNWEAQHNYDQATAAYKQAENFLDDNLKAQESVLRNAFIQFDNGNETETLRLLKLLQDVSKRGKLKSSEQMDNVLDLFKEPDMDTGANAPVLWKNWHDWWPLWQKIATTAGATPDTGTKIIPIIPSLVDMGKQLGEAKRSGDNKQVYQLVQQLAYAARFYPNGVSEFAGVLAFLEESGPTNMSDLEELSVKLLEPLQPVNRRTIQSRITLLALNYFELNQVQKSLDIIAKEWTPDLEDNSAPCRALHRAWALGALNKHQDLEKLKSLLEKDLSDPTFVQERFRSVGQLAKIDQSLGQDIAAISLLKAELKNAAVAADSTAASTLKSQLGTIEGPSDDTSLLAKVETLSAFGASHLIEKPAPTPPPPPSPTPKLPPQVSEVPNPTPPQSPTPSPSPTPVPINAVIVPKASPSPALLTPPPPPTESTPVPVPTPSEHPTKVYSPTSIPNGSPD